MGRNNIKLKKAIFLDRDGVINKNIYYKDTKEWESPRDISDFYLLDGVITSLRKLQKNNFNLFIVTNQPSYAKGKTSLENLMKLLEFTNNTLKENGVNIIEIYCSFKHERSIHKEYLTPCEFRKPGIAALINAEKKYNINLSKSWMIGDRNTDIECGNRAGTKTIKINLSNNIKNSIADYNVVNLIEASDKILYHKD